MRNIFSNHWFSYIAQLRLVGETCAAAGGGNPWTFWGDVREQKVCQPTKLRILLVIMSNFKQNFRLWFFYTLRFGHRIFQPYCGMLCCCYAVEREKKEKHRRGGDRHAGGQSSQPGGSYNWVG